MADTFAKTRHALVGVGGITCTCCGGPRAKRVKATRRARARLKAADRRAFAKAMAEAA